jgi:HEAT repeat protein
VKTAVVTLCCLLVGTGTVQASDNEVWFRGKPADAWAADLKQAHSENLAKAVFAGGREAVPMLLLFLDSDDSFLRKTAADILRRLGDEAVPALGEALNNPEAAVRGRAATAVRLLGLTAYPAVIRAIREGRDEVRIEGLVLAYHLAREQKIKAELLTAVAGALNDKSSAVRGVAADVLGVFGDGAVPPLAAAMTDPVPLVRQTAALTLGRIGPAAGAATPVLTTALEDANENVRLACARALRSLARAARAAAPALITSWKKEANKHVRREVLEALVAAEPEAHVILPVLREAFRDASGDYVGPAALGLAALGPAAQAAVPDLLAALKDPQRSAAAAWTLARLGHPTDTVTVSLAGLSAR